MKNKTTHKPNITVYVGRSEQSDLRHFTFCRSDLRQIAKKPTITQHIKRYQKQLFFTPKNRKKTDSNNPQTQSNTQFIPTTPKRYQRCRKTTPIGIFYKGDKPMKLQDIHKQFAVKSFAKMMIRAEIQRNL